MSIRLLRLLSVLAVLPFGLASCAGGTIADAVPHFMGGLPKNAPPRPGTPEYEEYKKQLEGKSSVQSGAATATEQSAPR
jgi:hypothetical protein